MKKIDVFAHVLPPRFLKKMQEIDVNILDQFPYMKNDLLTDLDKHRNSLEKDHQQVISAVNLNPEDFVDPDQAALLCRFANDEIAEMVSQNNDIFPYGVAMLPMNNIPEALKIIDQQVAASSQLTGIQLFTRALNKPISDPSFEPIFAKMSEIDAPIWLHPVFDTSKTDNNLTFSWEYELTLAMDGIVNAGYFRKYPNLKIIVHHAGAMVPYFSQRIKYIQTPENYADYQKFYVDTAILGNPLALNLAVDFFGIDHVMFGTDSPFGIPPNGPSAVIEQSINDMSITQEQRAKIFSKNWEMLQQK